MANITTKELILIHLKASGPCGFPSILAYVKEQFPGTVEDHLIAKELTELIRETKIDLYDDGTSFW
jgi:hypothetical protein